MDEDKKNKSELSKQVMFNVMGTADDHIGNGTHKFVDFAIKMVDEFGNWIKPYLKLIYIGFRNFPINNPDIVKKMDTLKFVRNFNLKSLFTIDVYPDDFFKLEAEDYQVIQLARLAVQKLLARPGLKPREIVGIGNYLYALERLPLRTFGVDASIAIDYSIDYESYHESRNVTFHITKDQFSIQFYNWQKEYSDEASSSLDIWHIESNGERDINCELASLENHINESHKQDVEILVDDSSIIDFGEIDWVECFTSDGE